MRLPLRRVKVLLPCSLVERLAAQAGGPDISARIVRAVRADLGKKARAERGRTRPGR